MDISRKTFDKLRGMVSSSVEGRHDIQNPCREARIAMGCLKMFVCLFVALCFGKNVMGLI